MEIWEGKGGGMMNICALENQINKMGRSPQQIVEELKKFRKDVILLSEQRASFTKQYPNKWIAFYGGKLVFVAGTLDELLVEIDNKKIPRDLVITQFLSNEKIVMML